MDLIILKNNMKNKVIKYSNYSFLGFISLSSIYIFFQFLPEDSNQFVRRLRAIIGYFIVAPIILASLYFSTIVLFDYVAAKFKQPIKHFLFILPFLLFFVVYTILFIYAIFIKQY